MTGRGASPRGVRGGAQPQPSGPPALLSGAAEATGGGARGAGASAEGADVPTRTAEDAGAAGAAGSSGPGACGGGPAFVTLAESGVETYRELDTQANPRSASSASG